MITRKDAVAPLDQDGLYTEACVDLGELDADRSSSHHHDAGGKLPQRRALVAGPVTALLQSVDGGDERGGAHAEDQILCLQGSVAFSVLLDFDLARSRD